MAPNAFILKCLGYPELKGPDGKVVRVRVKKHLALLVFLAVEHRRAHSRDRLIQLLWPNVPSAKGAHSMATAISYLRTVLGREALPTHRGVIRLSRTNLRLDLDRLEANQVVGVEGEPDLDVDGFLHGFEIRDAPEFELWKEREHGRCLPGIHAGLLTLIDHGRRRGSHDEIMQWAERLLAVDHLAEEGVRAKMEALALVGDRFSALRVFEDWRRLLAAELGAQPSALVDGMATQLRKRGWEPKEPNPTPPVLAEQWRGRPFIGRKPEYRQLYETWEAVRQHRPQHFMILGESGVGKTTLAQRLITAAGLEGASVARVQCFDMEQRIPFGAIGALVSGLIGRPGVAATAPEQLAEVARIVPRVKDQFRDLPKPKPTEGETARLLFAEGVMDLLKAVMEERPLLLVVDDVHHADEASLAVLHLIMRRIPEGRFMVALTRRSDATLGAHPGPLLEPTSGIFTGSLRLQPLAEDDSHELLGIMLGDTNLPPPPTERRALVRASRGFPMVLELLAQDWLTHGQECIGLAIRALTPDLPKSPPTSPIGDLTERQLQSLPGSCRQVLSLAAVLGQRLNDLTAYQLVGLGVPATIESINELLARRLVRDVGNGLEFMNELVRAHVYTATPLPVRVHLHNAVAGMLLADPEATATAGLEIAWHLIRARRGGEAGPHLIAGAKRSLLAGAPDEVVLALRTGVKSLAEPLKTEATALLIEALHELANWKEALALSAPLEDRQDNRVFRVLAQEARWWLGLIHGPEQRACVDELLSLSQSSADLIPKTITLATFMSATIRDTGLTDLVRAAVPSHAQMSKPARASMLIARANLSYQVRDLATAAEALKEAAVIQDQLGAFDASRVRLEVGRTAILVSQGRYEDAVAPCETALRLAHRLDNRPLVEQTTANAALCYLRIGKLNDALQYAKRIRRDGGPLDYANATMFECNALIGLGRLEDAEIRLHEADDSTSHHAFPWLAQRWHLDRADVLWLLGKRSLARQEAVLATSGEWSHPLADSSTGIHLRWTHALNAPGPTSFRLTELLGAALERKTDAMDRYEILLVAQKRAIRLTNGQLQELDELNRRLPKAALARLAALMTG